MAISAANGTYLNAGPAKSGQVFAPNANSGLEVALVGTATFTLDGSATSATLNFIDGTQTVTFGGNNASVVLVHVVGGTQPAAAYISASADTITSTGCTVRFSIAGTASNTVKIVFFVMK